MRRKNHDTNELSNRQTEILKCLINHYVYSSEPVGSRTLSEKYFNSLSPATIRNALEEMERMGYLYKPHASAGRIPTEKSYRYFVAELMKDYKQSYEEVEYLKHQLEALKRERTEYFGYITKTLAELSHNAAIMLLPRVDYNQIRAVDFFKLSSEKVLAIIVFSQGFVEHKVLEVNSKYSDEQLRSYAEHINSLLKHNFSLEEIRNRLLNEMKKLKELFDRMHDNLNEKLAAETIIVEGQSNLFDAPEFSDVKKIKRIFKLFEERSRIVSLLDNSLKANGVKVYIGSEISEELEGAAMVTATYTNGNSKGTLGILGPVRMDYKRILPLVDSAANLLSDNI